MSRVEHDSYRDGPCLCGQGQVTKHVSSTDYPFGSATVTYSLDCAHCIREWRLEFGAFVEIRSKSAADAAHKNWSKAADELAKLRTDIIDAYMRKFEPRTKKAEMNELVRLNLYQHNYRYYIEQRRQGKTPGQIAHEVDNDASGLISIADQDTDALTALIAIKNAASVEWEAAGKRVVRRTRRQD